MGLDAGQDALQVGNIGQGGGGGVAAKGVVVKELHSVKAAFQALQIQQGPAQPAAQQAGAHRRAGIVQGRQQGPVLAVPAAGFKKLQVAPGLGVQGHIGVGVVCGRGRKGRPLALPGVAQVVHDGAGGARRQGQGFNTVGFQGQDAVVVQQGAAGDFRVESGGVHCGDGRGRRRGWRSAGGEVGRVVAGGNQDFGGLQAGQFQGQVAGRHLGGGEFAGSDIDISQAGFGAVGADGGQVVVGLVVQQGGFQHGAGGDHADHAPFHDAFGGGGVAELFADGDFVALPDEFGQVGIQGHGGDAGQGNGGVAPAHRTGGEGDFQGRGEDVGVVVKALVEVAHPKQQDGVRVGVLDGEPLAAHRGQALVGSGGGHSRRVIGRFRRRGQLPAHCAWRRRLPAFRPPAPCRGVRRNDEGTMTEGMANIPSRRRPWRQRRAALRRRSSRTRDTR